MTTDKKYWSQPQLIVLARGTPEESVLEGCKNNDKGAHGTANANASCQSQINCPGPCSVKPMS